MGKTGSRVAPAGITLDAGALFALTRGDKRRDSIVTSDPHELRHLDPAARIIAL